MGPGVGTPLPVGTGGGPGYAGGSYGGPSSGPVYGAILDSPHCIVNVKCYQLLWLTQSSSDLAVSAHEYGAVCRAIQIIPIRPFLLREEPAGSVHLLGSFSQSYPSLSLHKRRPAAAADGHP